MNKDHLSSNLSALERKINLLLGDHKTLKHEIEVLKAENTALRNNLKSKDDQINSFQNKMKISKIVNEIDTDGRDASELKRKIDDYIKEIDRCIAHLSK